MSTILLAHTQPMLREGLRRLFAENGFDVVAEAATAEGAVAAAELHCPSVCVVDADLPGGGLLAVKRISNTVNTAIVVLAREAAPDLVLAAVRAGANGVLAKSSSPDGLVRAVHAVLAGQAAIPRAAIESLVRELRGGGRSRTAVDGRILSLTERERQVLERMREGLTTAQVASELDVSSVTVRRHLSSIARKAGDRSRRDLLRACSA